jgi:hypothetical protein
LNGKSLFARGYAARDAMKIYNTVEIIVTNKLLNTYLENGIHKFEDNSKRFL